MSNNHLKRFVAVNLSRGTDNGIWAVWERIKLHPTVSTRTVAVFYYNARRQAQAHARHLNEQWTASQHLKQNKKAWRRWHAKRAQEPCD